jgi:NitT/TauT family transport system substrate-binding protein
MSECLTGILERKVRASAMWEPYISLLQHLGAGEPLALEHAGDDYLTGVVADGEWIRANEDAAIAYLKAHIRAHRFIRSEPFAAAQLIHRATGFPVDVAGSVITRVRWDAAPYGRDLDTMRRLAALDGSSYGTPVQVIVEPAYLSQAARALRLPYSPASSMADDWADDAL